MQSVPLGSKTQKSVLFRYAEAREALRGRRGGGACKYRLCVRCLAAVARHARPATGRVLLLTGGAATRPKRKSRIPLAGRLVPGSSDFTILCGPAPFSGSASAAALHRVHANAYVYACCALFERTFPATELDVERPALPTQQSRRRPSRRRYLRRPLSGRCRRRRWHSAEGRGAAAGGEAPTALRAGWPGTAD